MLAWSDVRTSLELLLVYVMIPTSEDYVILTGRELSIVDSTHPIPSILAMPIGSTPLNDGRHIPNLAFGTGTALKGKDAQDAVRAALYAGFRHVDTAQIYGNEESVGNGLGDWLGDEGERKEAICCRGDLEVGMGVKANRREDLWVTTKYGGGAKGPFEELKESLRKVCTLLPLPFVGHLTNEGCSIASTGLRRLIPRPCSLVGARHLGEYMAGDGDGSRKRFGSVSALRMGTLQPYSHHFGDPEV